MRVDHLSDVLRQIVRPAEQKNTNSGRGMNMENRRGMNMGPTQFLNAWARHQGNAHREQRPSDQVKTYDSAPKEKPRN